MRAKHCAAIVLVLSCSDGPNTPRTALTGAVRISTTTSGQPPSGEGYAYILNDNPPEPIGFNATIELSGLPVAEHTVQLTSLPEGCTVSGANPVTVLVTDDVPGNAAFQVSCTPGTPPAAGNSS